MAEFTLEDGTGVADANSYADEDMADDYCEAHGITAWTAETDSDAKEAALIRGSTAIDARYGASYPGQRASGREQGMMWPRTGAYDVEGWLISDAEVPVEVINASIEAAVRELATPGSMLPDLERGGGIQSLSAGSVSITYSANASSRTSFSVIDGIISPILSGVGGNGGGLFGKSVRG